MNTPNQLSATLSARFSNGWSNNSTHPLKFRIQLTSYSFLLVLAQADFVGGSYTITMEQNSPIACTTINITIDEKPEGSEYFTVKLIASDQMKLGSIPEAHITIMDEGTIVVKES